MRLAILLGVLILASAPQHVAASCETEAAELRTHLVIEHKRAARWNTAFLIGYGTVAAAQFGVVAAETKPFGTYDDKFRDSMLVGGAKATLGLGVRVFFGLHVDVPAATGTPCEQVTLLRAALADGGARERRVFFLNHLGGLAVNLAGAGILWSRHDLTTAAVSLGSGIAAGILAGYTQPRRSWHAWRERRATWTAAPVAEGGITFGIFAEF